MRVTGLGLARLGFSWHFRALLFGAAAATLGTSLGCGHPSAADTSTVPTLAPTRVATVKPKPRSFRCTIEQPGLIQPFEQTPLYAKISGYVQKVNVEIGARVRKGDILAELWVPEMDEELRQKEALIAQARIEVKQAEKALRVTTAGLQTAQSLVTETKASLKGARAECERWNSEYNRFEKLASRDVVDKQSRDEVRNQFKAAEAACELAEAKIRSAEAAWNEVEARRDKGETDLEAARNRQQVAEADYRRMAALLQYAKIRAPFDGVVSQRHVDTGHFLQPANAASGGKAEPLFVVVRMDLVRVFVDVPEADAVLVREGGRARIRIQALNDQEFEGKVAGTSWALDPNQRTLRTEIDFPNPEGKLRPGMYAYASITIQHSNILTLPVAAILTRDGQTFCYCVEQGKAVRTLIRVGAREQSAIEVLKKQQNTGKGYDRPRWVNFTGAEIVIQNNLGQLIDGQAIRVAPRG
jgi:HlyD family secretion protein